MSGLNDLLKTQSPVRPVRCFYCGKRMYYDGEPGFEPELRLIVQQWGETTDSYYLHKRCWDDWTRKLPE